MTIINSVANQALTTTSSPTFATVHTGTLVTGYATTATAAAVTTLTVTDKQQQFFTGSTTQTVLMPVTSTLVLGQSYYIVNLSSGTVTVESSGSNTIQAMTANTYMVITCILTSGTTAASWSYEYAPLVAGGGGVTSTQVQQSAFNYSADTGSVNVVTLTLSPAISGYTDGLLISFTPNHANTSTTPFVLVNGNFTSLIKSSGALNVGDYTTGQIAYMIYSSAASAFVLLNPQTALTSTQVQTSAFNYGIDTGAADAYVVTLNPAIVAYTDGLLLSFTPTHTSLTVSPTITLDGGAPINIISETGGSVAIGALSTSSIAFMIYSVAAGDQFILLNPYVSASGVTSTQVQQSAFNVGTDTGAADAYIVDLSPAVTSLTDGLQVVFSPSATNLTTTPTLQINALAAAPILFADGNPGIGDLNANTPSFLIYSANLTSFNLINPVNSVVTPSEVQQALFNTGSDTGAADAYVVTLSPAVGVLTDGLVVSFIPANNNLTTSPTLDVGTGATAIYYNGLAVSPGDLVTTNTSLLIYSTASSGFELLNPAYSLVTPASFQANTYISGTDSGSLNTYILNTVPSETIQVGQFYVLKTANSTNTGTTTLNINGHGAMTVIYANGGNIGAGSMLINRTYLFFMGLSTHAVLINPSVNPPASSTPTFTSIAFSPTTSGIIGTATNDDAAAGKVGEFISSVIASGSPVSFTNTVAKDLTSISLSAGDWDIYGNILFTGTTTNAMAAWTSLTSATLPDASLYIDNAVPATSTQVSSNVPFQRYSLSTTTTVYISGIVDGTGTLNGVGGIYARRVR